MPRRIIILGAAGRDFHNFNVCYRNNKDVEVLAFTATQIPDIDGRRYPAELAGEHSDQLPVAGELLEHVAGRPRPLPRNE